MTPRAMIGSRAGFADPWPGLPTPGVPCRGLPTPCRGWPTLDLHWNLKEQIQNARLFHALQMEYLHLFCPSLIEEEARKQLEQCKSKCKGFKLNWRS